MDPSFCVPNDSNSKTTTYKFVVDKFSNREGDKLIDSPYFHMPDVKLTFELSLYPKKDNLRRFTNNTLIYLGIRNDGTPELNLQYQISILNKNGEKCHVKDGHFIIKGSEVEYNWFYCISRDYLVNPSNGLLPNDTLTVNCEISVVDQLEPKSSIEIAQKKHNTVTSDLQFLFDSKKYADVVLASGETEFSVHKVILSARSPVFGAMFEHECEEKKQNRVEITDIDAEVLGELLRYIYTGTVSSMEKYSDDLLVAADKYQIDSLKSVCEQSLSLGLTTESAMKLLVLSDMHNASNLKANCLEYISNHSSEVTEGHWNAVISARPELTFKLYNALSAKK